ncbi:glycosyltransferase [Patescibacteria group bacterium]
MKLVYLSTYNIPTKNALGIQITQMCNSFAGQGVEVELIVPKQKKKEKKLFEYYNMEKSFKVKEIFRFELSKFGKIGFLVQTILFLLTVKIYLLSKKYDVLYTREQLAGLFFKGFVYEIHNFPQKITFLHRLIFKRIFKVIAITSFFKKDLIKNGISSEKILVSADAADLDKFNINISQEVARKKLSLPEERIIIGYVGKYVTFGKWNKGADDLIKSFPTILKYNPEAFLLVVGVGEGNVAKVEKLLNELDISNNNYKIIAHLPYEKVIYCLRASDMLVMNYSKSQHHMYYTSPMKMFEYMASGRPIIASRLPSVTDVLNENNAFFIEPDSVESLTNGIKKALQDKGLADKIANQAYTDVQNYTWQKRSQQILDFIKKI